ncbi:MAG TPA: Asp-tRNA(Asn)/Glu-tRNA(Gln) amidotransferase subunit GatB [Bacillota bacterium]|jgi:aspartyl-tRNA(Asn)/glutamyl-tRNA(Gln) amidotransferase subunit B|nr:Asp-tRNA(Asn)/Glu-tRNA(Gln) amidotransferase subunit GatB [Bacillota bacterium]HOL08777.1 Asp-tRNA(Asn)/Glu-tRNA(Gln) amidotransferase subunit GatB [Bacillota bacterium]HPO96867.1 Asp-tRNA(Asn)/Glu-tRNA(Gln) amidotransferase subunit GatB [Bacillota bacterium]
MPLSDYEIVIGLEVHAELKTKSKIFCGCPTEFGGEPNSHVCPVCLGLPGALPVLNETALDYTILAGLALNCEIAHYSKFDRKQYFYPDLPKAYQISQYDLPFCKNGWIEVTAEDGTKKKAGIIRVHLEEEAGKTVHSGTGILDSDYALQDYNRCGIPLIEIVGAPDLRSPREAREYLEKLKLLLQYAGVSDCKMEEGSLRCDANISIRPKGSKEFGVLAEIKNMNSFKAVQAALEYEAERQADLLDSGEKMVKQTRTWDENKGITVFMRSKEDASDYRYFPDPDLLPVIIEADRVARLRTLLPEMPDSRRQRYINEWGLPEYDAGVISSSRELADFFEAAVKEYGEAKTVSNWVMGEFLRLLNQEKIEISAAKISPSQLVQMLKMIDAGTISGKIAKTVFEEMFKTGNDPAQVVKEQGLVQISDAGELEALAQKIIAANPKSVADYLGGKEQAIGYLVGQMMKETKGRANPGMVNELLRKELDKLK